MLLTFFYAANSFAQTEEAKCFSAFNELRINYLKAEKTDDGKRIKQLRHDLASFTAYL